MKGILLTTIQKITGKVRYMPVLEWSSNSWVHNIFRCYEYICGKRWGITTEAWSGDVTIEKNGVLVNVIMHEFHTFEAVCAHAETQVRELIRKVKEFDFSIELPVKFYVYKLQTNTGYPGAQTGIFGTPYLFAVAIDATTAVTATNGVSNKTYSHTTSGSDRVMWNAAGCSTSTISSVTYNSVSNTRAEQVNLQSSWAELWYLAAPATGSNTVSITTAGSNSITGGTFTFTGASQTGIPDAVHKDTSQTSGVTSYSQSITTVADNCMIVMAGRANGGAALTGGTNTTVVQPEVAAMGMFAARSTNPITPAGSAALAMTSSSQQFFACMASFKPVGGTAFTQSVPETITLVETTRARISAKLLQEVVTLVETISRQFTALRTLVETVVLVDTVSTTKVAIRAITEVVTLVETTAVRITGKMIAEVLTLVDTVSRQLTVNRVFTEVVTLVDTVNRGLFKVVAFVESITLTDVITRATAIGLLLTERITITLRYIGLLNGKDMRYIQKYVSRAGTYIKKYLNIPDEE